MIRVCSTATHTVPMRLRMPFRYGIATLTELPHLFVQTQVEVDGQVVTGVAADGLAPKWFTKQPQTSLAQDTAELLDVVAAACRFAERAAPAATVFALWQAIYAGQAAWGQAKGYPPLLWGFGVSLIERTLIDAWCRATGVPFAQAVRTNTLGIRLDAIHPDLQGYAPSAFLSAQPLRSIRVRHTVGLSDPITDAEIAEAERLDDGLPHSLEANIRTYGLTHFKIKLSGDGDQDLARLIALAQTIERLCPTFAFTLDGNEQYHAVETFRAAWLAIVQTPQLQNFLRHLLFVEQPLHRDVALSENTGAALHAWPDRPPMIIDESDGELTSVRLAGQCGYVGTSHKNCKGVFKGIANACWLRHTGGLLSGEDLCNVGPVALLQDLAVVATLGIEHVERNGHHYLRGLSMYPSTLQHQVVVQHADIYRWHGQNFATLTVSDGVVDVGTVVNAPFGYNLDLELAI